MKNVICILACLALAFCMTAVGPNTIWAGTSSGLGSDSEPTRDLNMDADLICGISLNIEPTNPAQGPSATALNTTAFQHNTPNADTDTINFGSVNLVSGSTALANGGNLWDMGTSANIIGEITVTVNHTCGLPPDLTIEAASISSPPPGTATVRYSTSHEGSLWETNMHSELTATADTLSYMDEVPLEIDIGFNIPKSTESGSIGTTVTFTTIGGI
jgi:hypothetical protein